MLNLHEDMKALFSRDNVARGRETRDARALDADSIGFDIPFSLSYPG